MTSNIGTGLWLEPRVRSVASAFMNKRLAFACMASFGCVSRLAAQSDTPGLSDTWNAGDWQWDLSGHARTMSETYRNLDFGIGPVDDDTWVHQRIQALAGAEKEEWRFVAEFTWGRMWGKKQPLAPPDQDDVDLLQGHVQYRFQTGGDDVIETRIGRQDLYYGSGRLLASREGANQRLSHDAARVSWQGSGGRRVDVFIASPVVIEPDAFDNESHFADTTFWGIYSTLPWWGEHLDLYYIGLRDSRSFFAPAGGHENRHTLGTRFWTADQPFICDTEVIVQGGEAGDRDIFAGATSVNVGWLFEDATWTPALVLKMDVISGGDDSGAIHTFDPLFQANNYFNEGGFISPSNLINLNPRLTLNPASCVAVNLGVNFQWRFDPDDSVYDPTLEPVVGPAPGGERYLGTAFNLSVEWTPRENTTFFLGYTHHDAGPSLTAAGGHDVDYLQLAFRQAF